MAAQVHTVTRTFRDSARVFLTDHLYTPLRDSLSGWNLDYHERITSRKLEVFLLPNLPTVASYTIWRLWCIYLYRLLYCTIQFLLFHLFWQKVFPSPLFSLKSIYRLDPPSKHWRRLPVLGSTPMRFVILSNLFTIGYVVVTFICYRSFFLAFYRHLQEGISISNTSRAKLKHLRQVRERAARTLCPGAINDSWLFLENMPYMRLLHYKLSDPNVLSVSLEALMFRILSGGRIDLSPSFISDQLQIDGFDVRLHFDGLGRTNLHFDAYTQDPSDFLPPAVASSNRAQTLDEVPLRLLPDFIFIFIFRASIPPQTGSPAVLHFSAGNDILLSSPDSRQYRMARLGLRPRDNFDYIYKIYELDPNAKPFCDLSPDIKYTQTPLHTSADDILQLLTSSPTPLHIHSIRDMLEEHYEDLNEQGRAARDIAEVEGYKGQKGNKAFGMFKFVLADDLERLIWLAAVMRAKLLRRWEVVVIRD